MCSARLSTGVPDAQTADEMHSVLALRPATCLPSVLLADYNTWLVWTGAAGAYGQPTPTTGRADYLYSEMERRGYHLCPGEGAVADAVQQAKETRGQRAAD